MPARQLFSRSAGVQVLPLPRPSSPYSSACFACQSSIRHLARVEQDTGASARLLTPKRGYVKATSSGRDEGYKPPPGSATMTRSQRALEASKTMVTGGFVLGGILVFGGLIYVIGTELTSSDSATSVYHDLLEQLKQYPEVEEVIGVPFRGFHEHGTRARSVRRVNNQVSEDGQRMFIRFYIEGPTARGAVNSELHLNEEGKWDPYVLYFESPGDGLPSKRVFLVDKRPPLKKKTERNRRRGGGSRGQAYEGFEGGRDPDQQTSGVGSSWPRLGLFGRKN